MREEVVYSECENRTHTGCQATKSAGNCREVMDVMFNGAGVCTRMNKHTRYNNLIIKYIRV